MKTYKELDVDFIGGAEPLTAEEEKMISNFVFSCKDVMFNKNSHTSTFKREKIFA
ncbi:MAG: hypothetical protein LBN95_07705 [Prevotellaceae bacterium]|jgi:hypothetical protein|nr:hypothetical protein [Prevotellaceae bacterium]